MVPTGCGRPSSEELLQSGTHMAVGNQRAALINKQLDGMRRGEARRDVTHHFIIHSHAVT